jgi:acyl-CoA hydrolase
VLRSVILAAIVSITAPGLQGCGRSERHFAPRHDALPSGAAVLVLGDSIAAGTGASADTAFPALMARATGWSVVNASVPGETSGGALSRLDALLSEHRPALVIVEIGGNDLLRSVPVDRIEFNLKRIIGIVRGAGAIPVLVAIPNPSMMAAAVGSLRDHPIYETVARAEKVFLIEGTVSTVLSSGDLRADQIHPNSKGHEKLWMLMQPQLTASGLLKK